MGDTMIFGKRGCNHDDDWLVQLYHTDGTKTRVTEQRSKEGANKVFDLMETSFNDKKSYIKVSIETRNGEPETHILPKNNITDIRLYQED